MSDTAGTEPNQANTNPNNAEQPTSGQARPDQVASEPAQSRWYDYVHLATLLVFLTVAIGTTCEISSRNEDYARVLKYRTWLVSCPHKAISDIGCPSNEVAENVDQSKSTDQSNNSAEGKESGQSKDPGTLKTPPPKMRWTGALNDALTSATTQVRRYDSLNSIGTGTKCMTAAVIASPEAGFFEACAADEEKHAVEKREHRVLLKATVSPSILSFNHWPLSLNQRPKDELYFMLVLVSAAIGSLVAGLRKAGFTTIRDLILGLGAGFAVYLLVRSGNFVFLASPAANIDILNPYSAAAVGMLVGLFSDRAFKAIDGAIRSEKPPNPQ